MAQVSKYRYLLNQYPETVQKEQFRIICHISKRTARYLLQSGLVPCVQSGKKTRNYTIKMKDIVRYLERREIHPEKYKLPPGSYSGTYAVKPLLPESVTTEELRKYYIESFRDIPDIVSTREAAELTGATASTVAKWIRTKKLKALSHGPAFIIPKVNLIDFMRYDGQVFISFSGGKDSTVLLDLARRVYPDIPAVYVDTGLEYPELRDFVKTKDNVIWLRPRYPFTQILEKYGYPIISKEVSDVINGARKGQPYRLARLNGELLDKNGKKSIYNCENYKYLLDAPFKISARCCYHMKKAPLNKFERQSGRHPITGVLACESKLREQSWIKFGCNGFERQRPLSQPLAFWLEEDILRYLKMTGIPYAPIYGDIVESRKKNGTPILKTTGVSRSGCMYCMYGVHLEHEPNRFQLMQVTHPQQYDYCINKLGCGAVLDYIGVPYRNQQLEVDHC